MKRGMIRVWMTLGLLGALGACIVGGCDGIVDDAASKRLESKLGDATMVVFPAYVREGESHHYDRASAQRLAAFLEAQGYAVARVGDAEVPLTTTWGMNQAKMFRHSAADFSAYVRANPIETDYAVLPEYLIGGKGAVGGVHVYLVDVHGAVAYASLANAHHKVFSDVSPKTVDDCTTIVEDCMRADLARSAAQVNPAACPSAAAGDLSYTTSLTIFPIAGDDGPQKDFADVLGLMLEREGMPNVHTADAVFTPAADAALDATAQAFAAFVRDQQLETQCAVFGVLRGTPQTGLTEARLVLVDRAGQVLWTDRQAKGDEAFDRLKPDRPMIACLLLKERLSPQFKLDGTQEPIGEEGRMHRLWSVRSGTPSKAQREAMESRVQAFKAKAADARVLVYPALVGDEVDRRCAEHLAALLTDAKLCQAAVASEQPRLEVARVRNEQQVLWSLARAVKELVTATKPDADYVLYADYMIAGSGRVGAVHFVVCDRAGEWVIVDFQNEYQADFRAVNPASREDCDTLVLRRIESCLR